ncbi:MAG: toxic anion resistance protein, partial [Peptococcaceae bacterium]|nr:toxic anion resistance protein [Peptococcaceae bacterium]
MAEIENGLPKLVLEGKDSVISELTLSAAELPAAPESGEPQMTPVRSADAEVMQALTEEEKAALKDFVQKIDLTDSVQILQYGSSAQKKISAFSESALANVRTKDMDEVGNMISGLVMELKGFAPDEDSKGFFGIFKKAGNQLAKMKTRYDTIEKNVDKICDDLENHKITLLKDVTLLDKMYDMNLNYYKELTLYILAGREKLELVTRQDLTALQEKARESGKPEDAQAANDLADLCNRFDKKLHDLDLTRTICIQMGPQIRLVQNNNSIMVEKIQSSLVNTIPLWKNQIVLALGIAHSKNAIEAQKKVTDLTNDLLRKNADMLKSSTIEAAKESERAIVDIETLKHTNQQLISTLDEVLQIQREGKVKRQEAQKELGVIVDELKNKLMEVR